MASNYLDGSLAQEYLALVSRMGRVSSQYQRDAKAIDAAEPTIRAYYDECHGLGKLQIPGIRKEAMTAVDILLRKGQPGAIRTLQDMKTTRLEARLG